MKKMTLIEKASILKSTPMFRNLDLNLLLPVADKLTQTSANIDEIIFDIGNQAYSMYFIADGNISISENEKQTATLKKGNFFGEESLFSGMTRQYKAKCLSNCILLTLSRSNLLTILYEYPSVTIGFLELYASAVTKRPDFKKDNLIQYG